MARPPASKAPACLSSVWQLHPPAACTMALPRWIAVGSSPHAGSATSHASSTESTVRRGRLACGITDLTPWQDPGSCSTPRETAHLLILIAFFLRFAIGLMAVTAGIAQFLHLRANGLHITALRYGG